MNLKTAYIMLLLFTMIMLVGCYTKLGYYESTYFTEKQQEHVERTDKEIKPASDTDMGTEKDDSDGYYGRRKHPYRSKHTYTDNSYWVPYRPYPYTYYQSPMYYYPNPWYYGYYAPYGYYGGYYPYRSYYGRYHGRTFHPASRRTYKRSEVLKGHRSAYRRARYSRSITSSTP